MLPSKLQHAQLRKILFRYVPKRNGGGLEKMYADARIVPDLMDGPPHVELRVAYRTWIKKATELKPNCTGLKPVELDWAKANKDSLHTILLTDPDVPSRADNRDAEFLHWLVVNVPGREFKKGDTVADYVQPVPKKDTGLHRLCFNVFKQCYRIDLDTEILLDSKSGRGRCQFNTRRYQDKHLFSRPLAGTFFYSQFDESVTRTQIRLHEGTIERDAIYREQVKGPYCHPPKKKK